MTPPPPQRPAGLRPWRELHLWQIQPLRDVLVIVIIVLLFRLGYTLRLVTVPILLALLLAYLFEPLVQRLTRIRRVNRSIAAGGIIIGAGLLVVVPIVVATVFAAGQGVRYAQFLSRNVDLVIASSQTPGETELRQQLPNDSWVWIRDQLADIREKERLEAEARAQRQREDALEREAREARERGEEPAAGDVPPAQPAAAPPASPQANPAPTSMSEVVLRWVRDNAERIGKRVLSSGTDALGIAFDVFKGFGLLVFTCFLTAFFFFFFSTGWGRVQRVWRDAIPERHRARTLELLSKMDRVVSGFVRGRLTISLIQCIIFSIGYWLVGVPMPLIIGPIVGILAIVPYVGLIGIPISVVAMWLDPQPLFGWQEAFWWSIAGPFIVYQVGQILDDYLLTPLIQGKATDMDTPAILFASISGGILAGVYGLLLAIPVAACLKIFLREVAIPRFREWTRGEASDPLPFGVDPVSRIVPRDPPPASE
ncbi:MAG: AI-2E family transporter [Phycisphaerales bacterium]|nr:AI-2E family transporter [Phycisphaerales bacterium]